MKERGSPEWCRQTLSYLRDYMRHVSEQWRQANEVLADLIATEAWKHIPPDDPYGTLNRMLKSEIGLDERAIRAAIRQAELAARGANALPGYKGWQRSSNTTSLGERGESYQYRRLCRDRPDLAQRVDRGELTTHAAALEAGFRYPMISVRTDSPESAARTLRKVYSPEDRERLARLLIE